MTNVVSNSEIISQLSQRFVQENQESIYPGKWLPELRGNLKRLRRAYRSFKVQVDYSNAKTVEAYMLAYAPYHVLQMYEVLERLPFKSKQELLSKRNISVVGFCSGPGPEVLALQWFLATKKAKCQTLEVRIYDKNAAAWQESGNFSEARLKGAPKMTWEYKECDINSFWVYEAEVEEADLVFIQNCSNEVHAQMTYFPQLLRRMKAGSHVIYSDLSAYRDNIRMMRLFRLRLQETHKVSDIQYHSLYNFRYTPEIEEYLFCRKDDLWARRCLKFASILFQKK